MFDNVFLIFDNVENQTLAFPLSKVHFFKYLFVTMTMFCESILYNSLSRCHKKTNLGLSPTKF